MEVYKHIILTKSALIDSIIIARFVKSTIMELRAIYPDYVRKLVNGVRLYDILPFYSVILIVLKPRRRVVVILVIIIFQI